MTTAISTSLSPSTVCRVAQRARAGGDARGARVPPRSGERTPRGARRSAAGGAREGGRGGAGEGRTTSTRPRGQCNRPQAAPPVGRAGSHARAPLRGGSGCLADARLPGRVERDGRRAPRRKGSGQQGTGGAFAHRAGGGHSLPRG